MVNNKLNITLHKDETLLLNQYTFDKKVIIKEIKKNLSGITFNTNTKTLFGISNSPRYIYELSKEGKLLRKIKLSGFKDTEGIVYIKESLFAIIDEKKHTLFIIDISKDTTKIDKEEALKTISINMNSFRNSGFEGIAYDRKNDAFFVVNERLPLKIIKLQGVLESKNIEIKLFDEINRVSIFMDDFSGLHYDITTDKLLFLSDASKRVAEVSRKSKYVSFMELKKGFSGLKEDIPQAEGIAVDDQHRLYIVSEPNYFYIFKKQ